MFKRNKYNAKSTAYNGRRYDSKFEAMVAQRLDWMLKAGELHSVVPQFKIELIVNGKLVGKHYVDFLLTYKNGKQEFWEAKGGLATQTDLWRLKKNITEALYPEIKYKVITS